MQHGISFLTFVMLKKTEYKQQHMYNQTHQPRTIFLYVAKSNQACCPVTKKYKTCKLLHNRKAQKVLHLMQCIAPTMDHAFSFFQKGMITGLYRVLVSNPVVLSPHLVAS